MRMKKKLKIALLAILLIGGIAFLVVILFGTVAQAVGLVDDKINSQNLYSQYPLDNYQLDFFVDTSWDWLPWNWKDGLGNQIQYGLYAIANFLWTINLYLSNATGYLVEQAYKLDFISDTADKIGENIQILAGVSEEGFSTSGFYVGFLLLFILIVGVYVAYTGLIKREASKAIQAATNFVVVFILSAGFIAFAPSYIQKINEFSADISQASLDLGSKIILPNSESEGKESVDLIRDTLFSIQVEQPWLLLQFDNSNKEEIGIDRVNKLIEINPGTNNGKDRENAVKKEIEDNDNQNLTLTKTVNRLGTTVFLVLFNIGISIFIFLLTGIMIFSQVLFIIYAMFLPISFLLSMLPSHSNMGKTAIMKLFNTIMLRAGITLIITTAFSLSTMIYTLTTSYPFFLIAFLQIVTFAGIYFKLGDIMSFFNLQSNDSQQMGRNVFRRPRQYMHRGTRRLQRNINRTLLSGGVGYGLGASNSSKKKLIRNPFNRNRRKNLNVPPNQDTEQPTKTKSYQTGEKIGKVLDSKNRVKAAIGNKKQQVKNLPQNMTHSMNQKVTDLKQGIQDQRTNPKTKPKRPTVSSYTKNMKPITNKSAQPVKPNRPMILSNQQKNQLKNRVKPNSLPIKPKRRVQFSRPSNSPSVLTNRPLKELNTKTNKLNKRPMTNNQIPKQPIKSAIRKQHLPQNEMKKLAQHKKVGNKR